jgi:acyl carrier protein
MSKVSFEEFSSEFAKDLEIDDQNYLKTSLVDILEYDSIGKITISLTIERLFGFQIAYELLDRAETIQSLYEFCCKQRNSN